jgi:hypothetical protein
VRGELERLEMKSFDYEPPKTSMDKLNEVFRASVVEAWGGDQG